jgi:hypothetical protein
MNLSTSLRIGASVLCLLTGTVALHAAAAVHAVNFSPAWSVGRLYDLDVVSTQNTRVSLTAGQDVLKEKNESSAFKMQADGEALTVLPNGELGKARYTVRSLRIIRNEGAEFDFLPKGTQVIVERSGNDESVTVDGKPATPEQNTILKDLCSTGSEKHNDQTIFGPRKPVAVGESWPVNTSAFLQLLPSFQASLAQGTVKLVAHEGEGAAAIAVVSGKITIGLKNTPLPPGFTPKLGEAVFELDGRIPATRSGAERREGLKGVIRIKGEGKGADGRVTLFQMVSELEKRSVVRYR